MRKSSATLQVQRLRQLLAERDRTVAAQREEIERLKLQLTRLRRWRFGGSSEQLDLAITQIEMTLEALQEVTSEPSATPESVTPTAARPPMRTLERVTATTNAQLDIATHMKRGSLTTPNTTASASSAWVHMDALVKACGRITE